MQWCFSGGLVQMNVCVAAVGGGSGVQVGLVSGLRGAL